MGSMALVADRLAREVPTINLPYKTLAGGIKIPHPGLAEYLRTTHELVAAGIAEATSVDFQLFMDGEQRKISSAASALRIKALADTLTPMWGTLLNANLMPYAGAYLSVFPMSGPGRWSDIHFKAIIRLRLLSSQRFTAGALHSGHDPPPPLVCPWCKGGKIVDTLGLHVFNCGQLQASRIAKHDNICDVLGEILRGCGEEVVMEAVVAPGHFAVRDRPGGGGRRQQRYTADVGVMVAGQLELAIDVSIASVGHTGTTAQEAGQAARDKEALKKKLYLDNTTIPADRVQPFVLETLGGWGEQAVIYIRHLPLLQTVGGNIDSVEFA